MDPLSRGMKMVMMATGRLGVEQPDRILQSIPDPVNTRSSPSPLGTRDDILLASSVNEDDCENILDLSMSQLLPFNENVTPHVLSNEEQSVLRPIYSVSRSILNRGNMVTNVHGSSDREQNNKECCQLDVVQLNDGVIKVDHEGSGGIGFVNNNDDEALGERRGGSQELTDGSGNNQLVTDNGMAKCSDETHNEGQAVSNLVSEDYAEVTRGIEEEIGVEHSEETGNGEDTERPSAVTVKKRKIANKESWKKNVAKKARAMGESYSGRRFDPESKTYVEVEKPPKALCDPCGCQEKNTQCKTMSNDERESVFKQVWEMSWPQKQVFVAASVDVVDVKRRVTVNENPFRNSSKVYRLKCDRKVYKVCKKMFIQTTGLSAYFVRTYATGAKGENTVVPFCRKQASKAREEACNFLKSLPSMPSHYCRASSSKTYLEPTFQSYNHLHRVYCEWCLQKNFTPLSRQVFRLVVDELNIAIFHPRKDQCDTCVSFQQGNVPEDVYQEHRIKKEEAQAEKVADKQRAAVSGGKVKVLSMDLQAVLLAPALKASALYYRTKLCVHNFTLFDMVTKDVKCYLWHEGEGGLTSNEFASCLLEYLENDIECEEVVIFSDGCTYQNRNATMARALSYFAQKSGIKVTQKILERGHTQMEVDSVHSTIERRLRGKLVHCPAEYGTHIANSRLTPRPYEVKYVDHTFFRDFTSTCSLKSIRPGRKSGEAQVVDVRALEYTTDGKILFKLRHTQPFQELVFGRGESTNTVSEPKRLYRARRKISAVKYKHLQELKFVLPTDYHSFYDSLPHE